jgi:hypothetical protein
MCLCAIRTASKLRLVTGFAEIPVFGPVVSLITLSSVNMMIHMDDNDNVRSDIECNWERRSAIRSVG